MAYPSAAELYQNHVQIADSATKSSINHAFHPQPQLDANLHNATLAQQPTVASSPFLPLADHLPYAAMQAPVRWPSELPDRVHDPATAVLPGTLASVTSVPTSQPTTPCGTSLREGTRSRTTLTKEQRRQLCLTARAHPDLKQADLAAMYGVERSTVSKILRDEHKYLLPEDHELHPSVINSVSLREVESKVVAWALEEAKNNRPMTEDKLIKQIRIYILDTPYPNTRIEELDDAWMRRVRKQAGMLPRPRKRSKLSTPDSTGQLQQPPRHAESPSLPRSKRSAPQDNGQAAMDSVTTKRHKSASFPAGPSCAPQSGQRLASITTSVHSSYQSTPLQSHAFIYHNAAIDELLDTYATSNSHSSTASHALAPHDTTSVSYCIAYDTPAVSASVVGTPASSTAAADGWLAGPMWTPSTQPAVTPAHALTFGTAPLASPETAFPATSSSQDPFSMHANTTSPSEQEARSAMLKVWLYLEPQLRHGAASDAVRTALRVLMAALELPLQFEQ